MELRRAVPTDAAAVANVFLDARAAMTYLPRVRGDEETRAWVAGVLIREREVWIAEESGRVAGFVALDGSILEHLYVDPASQGRGIGSLLLDRAKARRPDGLELWVFERNDGARRFYEHHGFELVRTTDGATNEEREPDALYAWRRQ